MIIDFTFDNAEQIINTAAPLVIEFHSPTCAHCKRTEAGIRELDAENAELATFAFCDISKQPQLAEQYDIQSLPTLLFVKDGSIKNKLIGFTHKLIIAEEIKKLGNY